MIPYPKQMNESQIHDYELVIDNECVKFERKVFPLQWNIPICKEILSGYKKTIEAGNGYPFIQQEAANLEYIIDLYYNQKEKKYEVNEQLSLF